LDAIGVPTLKIRKSKDFRNVAGVLNAGFMTNRQRSDGAQMSDGLQFAGSSINIGETKNVKLKFELH
jgi:hypothetical protein